MENTLTRIGSRHFQAKDYMINETELYYTYWINTKGKRIVLFTIPSNERPSPTFEIMYGMKQCNKFIYWLFKKTKINLLAKDKFQWLRS